MQKASSRFPIERFPGRVASGIVWKPCVPVAAVTIVNACQRGCESVNVQPRPLSSSRDEDIVVGGRGKAERTVEFRRGGGRGRERVEKLRKGREEGSEECETRASLHGQSSSRIPWARWAGSTSFSLSILSPCVNTIRKCVASSDVPRRVETAMSCYTKKNERRMKSRNEREREK